jgi:hypothetical protein
MLTQRRKTPEFVNAIEKGSDKVTKGELENLSELSLDDLLNISEMLDKYMKLYNIIQGTKKNFTEDRQVINKFNRCITKGL